MTNMSFPSAFYRESIFANSMRYGFPPTREGQLLGFIPHCARGSHNKKNGHLNETPIFFVYNSKLLSANQSCP